MLLKERFPWRDPIACLSFPKAASPSVPVGVRATTVVPSRDGVACCGEATFISSALLPSPRTVFQSQFDWGLDPDGTPHHVINHSKDAVELSQVCVSLMTVSDGVCRSLVGIFLQFFRARRSATKKVPYRTARVHADVVETFPTKPSPAMDLRLKNNNGALKLGPTGF